MSLLDRFSPSTGLILAISALVGLVVLAVAAPPVAAHEGHEDGTTTTEDGATTITAGENSETPTPGDDDDTATSGGHGGTRTAAANCGFEHPTWRESTTIEGVRIQADRNCRPDNPHRVAAFVKGTNNVGRETLMRTGLNRNAVVKENDRDGDGDPDVVRITLEVTGINEYDASSSTHQIAPGVSPPMWTFSPKGRAWSRADRRRTR